MNQPLFKDIVLQAMRESLSDSTKNIYKDLILKAAKRGCYEIKLHVHNDDGFLICDWLKQEGFTISNRADSTHYITVAWA